MTPDTEPTVADFTLRPTPEHCSDETINKISEFFGNELKLEQATAAAIERVNALMRPAIPAMPKVNAETLANGRVNEIDLTKRRYDINVDYVSSAPVDERFVAIDLNTYDGAPDSTGCSTFMGRGRSRAAAIEHLVGQFAEYDAACCADPFCEEHDDKPARLGNIVAGDGWTEPYEYSAEPLRDVDLEAQGSEE